MRERTACFTGHRSIPAGQSRILHQRLENVITRLVEKGYRFFGTGGALGFDTMAAQLVLALKAQYPHIRLILVLPCHSQTKFWNVPDKAVYTRIREQADKVVYVSQVYTDECMLRRNRHLVDCSSVCICYLTKATGGTAYTVRYAQKQGLEVINIAHSE